jgi:hypothetical protein
VFFSINLSNYIDVCLRIKVQWKEGGEGPYLIAQIAGKPMKEHVAVCDLL